MTALYILAAFLCFVLGVLVGRIGYQAAIERARLEFQHLADLDGLKALERITVLEGRIRALEERALDWRTRYDNVNLRGDL